MDIQAENRPATVRVHLTGARSAPVPIRLTLDTDVRQAPITDVVSKEPGMEKNKPEIEFFDDPISFISNDSDLKRWDSGPQLEMKELAFPSIV
jgi:hypothetical protein